MKYDRILLFSGGVDSYVAWHYLDKPQTVYFNVRSRYSRVEMGTVLRLIGTTIIDNSLDLHDREEEGEKAYIPFRNLLLACQAVKYSDNIVIAGLADDMVSDKNQEIFWRFSELLSELEGRQINVTSPFWDKTKEEVVRWYLLKGGNHEELQETFSCYSAQNEYTNIRRDHMCCGACPACFRKWVAFKRNGIYCEPFTNTDLAKEYYEAAKAGKYVAKRNEAIIKTVEETKGWDSIWMSE